MKMGSTVAKVLEMKQKITQLAGGRQRTVAAE